MQLSSNRLLYHLIDRWRGNVASLSCDGSRMTINGSNAALIPLSSLHDAPLIVPRKVGSELSITAGTAKRPIRIRSKDRSGMQSLAKMIEAGWREAATTQINRHRDEIRHVLRGLKELDAPTRYPAVCIVRPLLARAQSLEADLFRHLNEQALTPEQTQWVQIIRQFLSNPSAARAAAIVRFEATQIPLWSEFFDTFEKNSMTPEQRLSIVADEDATLVLAGAGSGKTSVITAKAGYLIKSGTRPPEEILLLAFGRTAAEEMSERIRDRSGEPVEARTFHALALTIIGQVEGGKPALADHATDDMAMQELLKTILRKIAASDTPAGRAVLRWFLSDRLQERTEWDFKQKHEFYTHLESEDLRTLQGEQVASYEEVMIANWLYANGVAYEYEPDYAFDTSSPTRRNYCPDFRLSESGVYLEHFGVQKAKGPRGEEILVTCPWIDRKTYLEGMSWKRKVHARHGTTLLETYSYERHEGRLLEALAEKVAPHVTLRPLLPEVLFDRIIELSQIDSFVSLLATFLKTYKGGGNTIVDCAAKAERVKLGRRAVSFLEVFEAVYTAYEESLGPRIDFEDMILRAARYVSEGRYQSPYGHILVDEFQDISRSRARLVKALLSQKEDARLFAVGDDWQSIYRFAGSDIQLMRRFGAEFGTEFAGSEGIHRTVDLGRTFRSVDKIAFAARDFVLKNADQITKTIIPAGVSEDPAIKVVSTFKHDADAKLAEVLSGLENQAQREDRQLSVLLLGRYQHTKPENLYQLQRRYSRLKLEFRTFHGSKGLEADHVVLLQVFRGRIGFPSEIVDDPLLTMVSPETEPFEHAEERRVMYVALTRARQSVTILSSAAARSVFVEELEVDPAYGLASNEGEAAVVAVSHTCPECQGRLVQVPRKDGGVYYRCEHADLCGNSMSACTSCNTGLPVRASAEMDASCECGQTHEPCPACASGWLIERSGRYGTFMSCVRYPECTGKKQKTFKAQ